VELDIWRYSSDDASTLGFLMMQSGDTREQLCYTVEDAWHPFKITGRTRIPAGRYKIKFRTDSPMARRYAQQFPKHEGMLWLQDVSGFNWVYIHVGNDEDDTDGCILLGTHVNETARAVQQSRNAYKEVYAKLAPWVNSSEGLWLTVVDLDRKVFPGPGR